MGSGIKAIRMFVCGGAAMVLAAPGTANAQPSTAAPLEFHIKSQDLDSALKRVGEQSGREIMYPADAVAGRTSPPLDGRFTPDDAVRELLRDTDLVADFRPDVVLIRGRGAPPDETADRPAVIEDIVVVGTHIRGNEPTAPVVSASRQEIEERGLTDLGDYARHIPQNFSGGQNPGVLSSLQPGSENFGSSSTLNLRGLGPDATLTLFNGHRVAYDSVVQGVDIAAIPLVAIERVDVIADGSSALYGSDAVGGVANVVLRRDYDGVLASARFGAATDGGLEQQQYDAVAGARWETGGFMVAGDFNRSTAILAGQRELTGELDRLTTIYPELEQKSVVLAGHQQLGSGATFEIDAYASKRTSSTAFGFIPGGDLRTDGFRSYPDVYSFAVSPRLRFDLGDGWNVSLRGTHSISDSDAISTLTAGGVEANRNRISYDNSLDALELDAEGPLFAAPGGEARAAAGVGYRAIGLDADIQSTRDGETFPLLSYSARQKVYFGYGEVSLPLVGAANARRGLRRLNLTGAVRYEDYQGVAGTATPKLSLIFDPSDEISLRATWGKSFKAPTLAQQNQLREGVLVPAAIFSPPPPDDRPILLLSGTQPGLVPEKSTSWTASLILKPKLVAGLRVEASYFNTHYRLRVVEPFASLGTAFGSGAIDELILRDPTAAQVNAAIADLPLGLSNQTGEPFDPASVGAIIDIRLRNAAQQDLSGLDLLVDYDAHLSARDRLRVAANASYLESEQRLFAGQPLTPRAGSIFTPPHWRANANVTWERGAFALTGAANYIGGNLDHRFEPYVRVGSFTSFDAVARVTTKDRTGLLAGLGVTLSVLNILNESPALIRTDSAATPPYDATNYPIAGRVVSIMISKAF